jgi:hypothetical protein
MEKEISSQRSISIPKQKFAFKNRKAQQINDSLLSENKDNQQSKQISAQIKQSENTVTQKVSDQNSQTQQPLKRNEGEVEIKGREGETIEILEESNSFFIISLKKSTIKLSSLSSVFLDDCFQCRFYIRSQQVLSLSQLLFCYYFLFEFEM